MKFLYSFIISLSSVLSFSQTILYQQESTSRTVQDPQAVVLAQGFKATASTSNPFIAKIGTATENQGGGPTNSNAGATNPSGTTAPDGQSFHDTQGNIEVSEAGQLQFTLPIALPPGIKSVAPQINLVYASGTGNGIAGYGWNLSGITAISRIGKTIEKNGETKGVQLDYSDYYSFNGQRLILKSGEYGKDGAEYVTEKYSNVKIKSVGIGLFSGPAQFEVTFEDGSQAWYGATDAGLNNAKTPIEYNIVKWKDVQGNYITYNYLQSGLSNVAVISSIQWGGNETLNKANFNEILFTYISRDLVEQSYVAGAGFIQNSLLKEIKVSSSGNLFKKYVIEYANNDIKYKFVERITEYNANNEAANPIVFKNESSPVGTNIINSNSRYDDIYGDNIITGDFNGDGKLDFLKGNTLMLGRLDGNSNFINVSYEGSFLSVINTPKNNVLLDRQSFATSVYDYQNKKIIINYYALNSSNILEKYNSFVLDNIPQSIFAEAPCYPAYNQNMCNSGFSVGVSAKEGDFNGDGVSELLLLVYGSTSCDCEDYYGSNQTRTNTSSGEAYFYVDTKTNFNKKSTYDPILYTVGDFDGDGKSDLINLSGGSNIYSFNETSKDFELKVQSSVQIKSEGRKFGDFNGDGKMDILAPVGVGSSDWKMYISTGKGFKEFYYSNLYLYQPRTQGALTKRRVTLRTYSTSDFNKDGKSDLMIFESQVWFREWAINNPDSSYGFNYLRNEGVDTAGKPIFLNVYNIAPKEATAWGDQNSEDINYSNYGEHYIPLFGSFRIAQLNTEFVIIHKTKLITWDLGSKIDKISRINSITQGGIKTDIEYSPLVNEGNIYRSYLDANPLMYPYVNVRENLNYYVVSKLIQDQRKQEFRYRDLVAHLHGKGTIGFRQTARSTFFANGLENTKIWTGSEINPLNEGLPYKDWSIRTNDENKVFPADISLNNTQLLSFKQNEYKIDRLLNGSIVSSTVANTNKSKIVTSISPDTTTSKDFLKNITTVHKVEAYDNLYLPKKSVTKINDGFAVLTSELEYYPPNLTPGTNYSIGKPKIKTEVIQAYGDTKSSKQEYIYENNLVKTQITWNRNNSGSITETYNYDGFGNITKKVTRNSVDAQTQTSDALYDSKGRFVVKKKNNLGLETNIIYNDWGQIEKQTDPLGNTLDNKYDEWGKLLTSKTNLSGTTSYQYERDSNANLIITQNDPDGNISKKYTNKLGQEYKTSTKAFGQGQYISKQTQYDVLGRKIKESEPYFEGQTANQWNSIEYTDTVFPTKITVSSFNGHKAETTVSGLTTTVKELNGYARTTSKRTDALDNVIASTDKGGTINFSYNAAGEQIKAQYAENSVTTKYDVWGRKSEFNDPSNGIYKYEYDGFGQPKKIISPKGTKEYIYNTKGQLISQRELSTTDAGEATNKTISFSYDDKGRVISKSGTSKGQAYSSSITYDPQGRVLSSSESSNGKYFIQKGITYDDKARVTTYEKQLYSSGTLTKVQIENLYSNWSGELFQVKDKNTGRVLWQLQETNAKGQVLKARLGTANITNTYAPDGFLTSVNHSSTAKPSILQLSYSFDAIKNELKSRTTGGDFNIIESFDYDDNNRLVNWTNPVTGVKPNANRNVYDVKGRILENDQVGSIKFQNNQKIYQPTSMVLNATGTQNYNNDLIQSIVYNENNDPIFIDGEKGDVAFQYGLTSMRQRVSYGGNFATDGEGKFTKFYSEDGSFEVIKDNITGREKHILYIGGNPYDSNIVYLKDYTQSSGSFRFLHKDYIGSVLAISDEAGNKLEQRHFDAWGNFTHLKIGNAATLTGNALNQQLSANNLLIDRGYTSHEHFAEVGIIHMNGRLYDPLLRRFLNADENIQDPTNTQNYNKYGYVMNNPLMYNDPSGELIWFVPLIAAAVSEFFTMYYTQTPFDPLRLAGNAVISYISAGITGVIGGVFKISPGATTLVKLGTLAAKAGAHSFTQGVVSTVLGGNFWSGVLSAAFTSVSNDLLGLAGEGSILASNGFALFSGAVTGGVGSVLGGGNFWMGAGQGLIVTAFNFLAHKETTVVEENNTDGDCSTCPKNAKNGQFYTEDYTIFDKEFWTWDNISNGRRSYSYWNDEWKEIKPFAGTVPIGPAGSFNILKLKSLKSALSLFKGGKLTNAGRAVTKHPEYFGFESTEALMKVFRSPSAINNLGATTVKNILRNGVRTTGSGGRYPQGWVTYTLPNGNAASWTVDGIFIGFRGLK